MLNVSAPGGLCHSSVSAAAVTRSAALLLGLLKLSAGRRTRAAKALLQHVGVCWLYPLVVILFCFNDLKAKLLVKIDGRLVVDLHVTVGRQRRQGFSNQGCTGVTMDPLC